MGEFTDISARIKTLKGSGSEQDSHADDTKPVDYLESFRIRARMVGVLLRDARIKAERTLEDCARLLRVDIQQIESWEFGDAVPSLPQLEILAFYLDVPISHFWSMDTLEATVQDHSNTQNEYIALRNRIVGALLRIAREERDLTVESVSATTGVPADMIEQYELGDIAMPMHELTVLSNAVGKNISYFLESRSHLGELLAMREEWKHFTKLPEDIRKFAANPLNIGFIEIAIMFSQMPADRLRKVGESVLNITM